MKTQPGAKPKASVVELAGLMGLCLLAGIGAGLAFESAPIGLALAGIGLIAVAAYALAVKVVSVPAVSLPTVSLPKASGRRERRQETRGLSVTDISTRRSVATSPVQAVPKDTKLEPTPEPEAAPEEAPISAIVATAVEPDRVVPFRIPPTRL
jgi:hypothetical protein